MENTIKIDKIKLEELCREEIENNIENEQYLPLASSLLNYNKNLVKKKVIAEKFKELIDNNEVDSYSIINFLDIFDLRELLKAFPACIIWLIVDLKEKSIHISSLDDVYELAIKHYEEKYRIKLGYVPVVKNPLDIQVILYLHTTSWITNGFIFTDGYGKRILTILSRDYVGTSIIIDKEFVNKDNPRIYRNGMVKDIYSIEDFTYDKFNENMISEEVFNYIRTMILKKKLDKLSGINYYMLSENLLEDREESIKLINKIISEANEEFNRFATNLIKCDIRL